ncbi:hypothetical protein GQX74_009631 [Glossina fuscipes]|nr:hypothetical protein GQX74_009631 [Glossina fuscipes]
MADESEPAPEGNIEKREGEEGVDKALEEAKPNEESKPGEEAEEDFPLIDSSTEDPEQERNYADYKNLVKEIKCQTAHLENIKDQIQTIACKTCKTPCEEKDLKDLQTCLDREMEKQRCLINKIIYLQNFGSKRRYKEIDLTTTFDEDQMISEPITCESMMVKTSAGAKEGKREKKEDKK